MVRLGEFWLVAFRELNMDMDKFCLKWNDFEINVKEYFKTLKDGQRLFDVTLVSEDCHHIQAHKIVLSAGSHFFNDVFMKSNESNMLIYMKGIRSTQLEQIVDFMYKGEVFIANEEFKEFVETGNELRVKGLMGDLKGDQENVQNDDKKDIEFSEPQNQSENTKHVSVQDMFLYPMNEVSESQEYAAAKIIEDNIEHEELDNKIEEMIEKHGSIWKCKICGKTSTKQKQDIQRHVETHIEGMSHACHICNRTLPTRNSLRMHKKRYHK